ncbi:hypothetical protein MJL48_33180, partial [Salmonella enterica subsp. enterica serovar Kentucky]|nr:hypothetical protein [Salmonella enterica subsp. enterica serovar Kentucky]
EGATSQEAFNEYLRCYQNPEMIHAICEDYRAAATIDLDDDAAAKNWLNVYFGNLIGALLFVLLMWLSGEYMTANGQWGLNVLQT